MLVRHSQYAMAEELDWPQLLHIAEELFYNIGNEHFFCHLANALLANPDPAHATSRARLHVQMAVVLQGQDDGRKHFQDACDEFEAISRDPRIRRREADVWYKAFDTCRASLKRHWQPINCHGKDDPMTKTLGVEQDITIDSPVSQDDSAIDDGQEEDQDTVMHSPDSCHDPTITRTRDDTEEVTASPVSRLDAVDDQMQVDSDAVMVSLGSCYGLIAKDKQEHKKAAANSPGSCHDSVLEDMVDEPVKPNQPIRVLRRSLRLLGR